MTVNIVSKMLCGSQESDLKLDGNIQWIELNSKSGISVVYLYLVVIENHIKYGSLKTPLYPGYSETTQKCITNCQKETAN